MYKLLLVTDQPEIAAAFEEMDWMSLGFKKPRCVSGCKQAMESLAAHHEDAIAISLPESDMSLMDAYLNDHYPLMPMMTASSYAPEILNNAGELRALLNRINADFSNETFGPQDMMQLCRHEFFRRLISGSVRTPSEVKRQMRLLRSRMDPDKPCVLMNLAQPADTNFLNGRWHYGRDRLEIAMRNFLGAEFNGLRILVSVLPDEQIRLLACPMLGRDVDSDSITACISDHARPAMDAIHEYLGLDLHISNITVLPSLTRLAVQQ